MDTKFKIIFYLFLTVILWGSSPIIEKIGLSRISPFAAVTIRSSIITIVLLVIMLVTGRSQEIMGVGVKSVLLFACSGIMAGLLGMWTYFKVLQMGEVSKIVPVSSTYPLIAAFLGIIVLGEEISLPRILGTLLIVTGTWLVISK